MLVVSRRRNESIMIRDDVEVTIVEIARNQVKIGIEAPREIPVHRREIYERIKAQESGRDESEG
jgi:carbon storage regulator